MMAYKICPRCFKGRPYNELCQTPECAEKRKSPSYFRDELEGQLHIAREQLKTGDTEHDWATIVRELETELMLFDAQKGAAAFTQ
jgi:hypothetical protein